LFCFSVLKRAETWSSPEALHAHSTPKAIMNPSYYNPQSSRNSREPFLPNHPESSDSPLDLRQITNKSKNNSVDESENRKISNTFDASPESGNRGPSFLKLNQSVDDYNFFPAPLNPEQSNQSKGMKRGSKKVTFQRYFLDHLEKDILEQKTNKTFFLNLVLNLSCLKLILRTPTVFVLTKWAFIFLNLLEKSNKVLAWI